MTMEHQEELNPSSQFGMDTRYSPSTTTNSDDSSMDTRYSPSTTTNCDVSSMDTRYSPSTTTNSDVSMDVAKIEPSVSSVTQASSAHRNNVVKTILLEQHKPVIDTLIKLYNETYAVLAGSQATDDKKQELDDYAKGLGELFVLLSSGEISETVSKHLLELCQMLDRHEIGTAFEILATLSKSHSYDLWVAPLKRMLNARVNGILSRQEVAAQLSLQRVQQLQQWFQQEQPAEQQQLIQREQQQQYLQQATLGQLFLVVPNPIYQSGQTSNTTYQGIVMPQARGSETNSDLLRSDPVVIPTRALQDVDTSSVPAQQKFVITTLTRLLNETNEAKKQEIQDNITKMTALFGKLDRGEISANAAEKIVELCQALDRGDFATALQIQVLLSSSHWGECNFWLGSLKIMIKQNERNQESFFA